MKWNDNHEHKMALKAIERNRRRDAELDRQKAFRQAPSSRIDLATRRRPSRRSFLTMAGGSSVAFMAAAAHANTPFTTFGYPITTAPGAPTRTTLDRQLDIVNIKEYGAVGNGIADDTAAFRAAFSAAFGLCSFVGDTGGVSSATLNVSSVNYGTIPSTKPTLIQLGGLVFGTLANTGIITLTAPIIGGQANVGNIVQDRVGGLIPGNTKISTISGTSIGSTIQLSPNPSATISTPQYFYLFSATGNPTMTYNGGAGGAGTYTLSSAVTIPSGTQLWCSNGTDQNTQSVNNRPVWIPSGHYLLSSPLILMNLAGIHIYGSGQSSFLNYTGTGAEGNVVSIEASVTPTLLLTGVSSSTIEHFSMSMPNNFPSSQVVQLVATSASATGSGTLTFNSLSDPANGGTVINGMQVWDISNGNAVSGSVVIANNPAAKTVTLRADGLVGTGPINNHGPATVAINNSIVFTSQATGIYMDQAWGAYCGANTFRDLSFNLFSRGIYTTGGLGNCDNCAVLECFLDNHCIAGMQLFGQNVLNWQVRGGGASQCARASTCDPQLSSGSVGNAGAAYSLGGSGCEIDSPSCSNNTWDVAAFATQAVTITGGRGEQIGSAPYMSEFTGYITAGSLTVTSFTRGQALQPGSIVTNINGGTAIGGNFYILSGTGPYAIGSQNGGPATGLNYGSVGSPLAMASPGIQRGQSLVTDSTMVVNGWGFGSGVPGITNGEFCRAMDATFGGHFVVTDFGMALTDVNNGWMAFLGQNGQLTSTETVWAGTHALNSKIGGSSNARVTIISDNMSLGIPTNLFTSFTGKVMKFTPWFAGSSPPDFTVAMLTGGHPSLSASAIWDRCRLYVTDYSVAWGSGVGVVGTSITGHGGGTHVVPVICPDGTGWVVSG